MYEKQIFFLAKTIKSFKSEIRISYTNTTGSFILQ